MDDGAILIKLAIALVAAYLLVFKPLFLLFNKARQKWPEVVEVVGVYRANRAEEARNQPAGTKGGRLSSAAILRGASVIIVAMFIYMPATSNIENFSYRFIWNMGRDGYYAYEPNVLLLMAQLVGVLVVAALLVASNKLGK
jgi:hypothetical protein